jgi:acetyl-CoA synthase
MSKIICDSAIEGAIQWVARADASLNEAIRAKGESCPVKFPDTAYFLPVIYSFTGKKTETLADLRKTLKYAKELLPARPAEKVWLPYLGNALDAGVAALFACEIIEACKYTKGPYPVHGIWVGAADDKIMRERGIEFVDGSAPGFAAITGAAPNNQIAVKIAKELQEKNIYVFMGGCTDGKQFAEQLDEEGIQLGWETRLVPFGRDVSALIYALGFANRVALSFGGVSAGDFGANLKYNKNRVFAFVLAFGEVTAEKYAVAAGAINYGFPVIADTDIPEILPTGVCTYEHVVSKVPYESMVEKALVVRGCKIRITKVPVPVPYGPAFEGERIRKEDVHVEFGGNVSPAFEFVTSVGLNEITDGEIELIGPDIDTVNEGSALPLSIWVEVAGRKMQSDFEPVLERQVHHFLNGAEGIWHMGQRDIVWTRVSKTGFANGLRLKHYGEIIHAKLISDYPAIVDKVKVTLITDADEVEKRISVARKIYDERNRRLEAMTDESVDIFYSCTLCQSFAPDHVCIITPERLGLCGAYNWLDGKAAYEIDETGPNQPVKKGKCLDPVKGVWKGIDDFVYIHSHKTLASFCAYSIMDRPMTSCGCFEVICAYVPELNGVMAVNREFTGETPVGMTFATLAGNVGGGQQTPGFIGIGKVFLTSKKFLYAEGGFKRLVWMPRELKELLATDLNQRFIEQGVPDLMDKIADETVGHEVEIIRDFMQKTSHPALEMEDMAIYAESHTERPKESAQEATAEKAGSPSMAPDRDVEISPELYKQIKDRIVREVLEELKSSDTGDVVGRVTETKTTELPSAGERIRAIKSFRIPAASCEVPVWQVTLGATREKGGTRGHTLTVGGSTCMPFHLWEGEMPNRPLIAMEVFDVISEKYPETLRKIYGDVLHDPPKMAQLCIDKYGADLISVRLEGTHPEKGNRSPEQSVELVKSVLAAVDVPLIITGHNHYERNNEVLKAVAQACAGENLLLNWVEQDNYRTIAGAALAYGHTLVAQSPIDVNIGKQLNILLTNMDVKNGQIIMDPLTGATGYGIEYTYSVMERIRLTGLKGDKMLSAPMIVSPGQECAKVKESKASEADFPEWGNLERRASSWELATALGLLYAGADILILYQPDAAMAVKKTIFKLMDGRWH